MKIICYVIIALIFFSIFLYFKQRSLIYFPSGVAEVPSSGTEPDLQVIKLHTADQLTLQSWFIPPKQQKIVIIYLHGNAGHLGMRLPQMKQLSSTGFGVLLLSYRGYAGNPGSPTEQGLYNDARAAINYLTDKGYDTKCMILYGESLGTGIAVQLATEYKVGMLILQAPYTSFTALGRFHYPWLPVSLFLLDKYDSLAKIDKINVPILILHGQQDDIVPVAMAQQLYERASEPKQITIFPGLTHNGLWQQPLVELVEAFIQQHLKQCLKSATNAK